MAALAAVRAHRGEDVLQRLCDVAEEVDKELERLLLVCGAQAAVLHALGVVLDGGDDAAALAAVAVDVDAAALRGRVWEGASA